MNLINFREFLKFLRCLGSQFKQLHYSTSCFSPEEITTQQAFYTLISFPTFLAFILPFFSILCGSSERTYIIYGSEPEYFERRASLDLLLLHDYSLQPLCSPAAHHLWLDLPKGLLTLPSTVFFSCADKILLHCIPQGVQEMAPAASMHCWYHAL